MVNSFVCDFHSNLFFESRNNVESDGRMCKIKSKHLQTFITYFSMEKFTCLYFWNFLFCFTACLSLKLEKVYSNTGDSIFKSRKH